MRDGGLEALDAGGERALQRLGALLHGLVEGRGPLHHHGLESGEVLRRAVDHLGETTLLLGQPVEQAGDRLGNPRLGFVDLLGRLARTRDEKLGQLRAALGELLVDGARSGGDVASDLRAHALQRIADARAVIGKRLALGGELADESPDAKLVLAIGPLERRHLAVHHGFELARPPDGARDGIVHGRDLAADGLADRGDRLLGKLVGLGEPDGDLGHGRSHEAELLSAPYEQGEEPENGDGNENGDGCRERRGAAEQT